MKKYLLILFVIPLMAMECENRKFEFVATMNLDEVFEIDNTGAFSEYAVVTRDEVLSFFDIPESAEIEDVNIESMAVRVVVLDDNEASVISLTGEVQLGSSKPAIFNGYPVPLFSPDNAFYGINTLISDGISGIRSKLERYLEGSDIEPFTIQLSGDSSPTAGNRIHITLTLRIVGTVKYYECLEVPFFVEGGDACDI